MGSFGTLRQGKRYLSFCPKGAVSEYSGQDYQDHTGPVGPGAQEQQLRVLGSRESGDSLSRFGSQSLETPIDFMVEKAGSGLTEEERLINFEERSSTKLTRSQTGTTVSKYHALTHTSRNPGFRLHTRPEGFLSTVGHL